MKPLFSFSLRSGLMALGLVAGLSVPSLAGPILQPDLAVPANAAAPEIMPVRDGWAGGNGQNSYNDWQWRKRHDAGRWQSNNFRERRFARSGNWNNGNWNDGNWNDDWRRKHRRHFRNSGVYLGLGLGIPAYQYYNNYDYYNVPPPPRRHYRAQRLSSAHVQWCYDRYRSYRAWDNTFQPYHAPRQQCWSPYS